MANFSQVVGLGVPWWSGVGYREFYSIVCHVKTPLPWRSCVYDQGQCRMFDNTHIKNSMKMKPDKSRLLHRSLSAQLQ